MRHSVDMVVDQTCKLLKQVTHSLTMGKIKKGVFSNSAVSSSLDRSKRFTLPPSLAAFSFRHQLVFTGKHSATLQLLHEDYSFLLLPLSLARYLFIYLSELGHCGQNENAQPSKQQQRGFEHSFSIEIPAFYHAPYRGSKLIFTHTTH